MSVERAAAAGWSDSGDLARGTQQQPRWAYEFGRAAWNLLRFRWPTDNDMVFSTDYVGCLTKAAREAPDASSLASAICSVMKLVQEGSRRLEVGTDQQSRADSTALQRLLLLKGRLGLEAGVASEADSRTVFLPRLRPGDPPLRCVLPPFFELEDIPDILTANIGPRSMAIDMNQSTVIINLKRLHECAFYPTDGLIFTPRNMWYCFGPSDLVIKWKPRISADVDAT
eukprot:m51a1_g12305 hypothetical protein (227) ;mRNA; r:358187-360681